MKRFGWALLILFLPCIVLVLYLASRTFDGQLERIQFRSNIPLEGALITPEGPGPHPAILLLHGAGSSHQPYDKLFFKFHANAFLAKGFAVLVYSKRSKKDVDYRYFTYQDLLGDAQAALDYLKTRKDIDPNRIGLMGISESGWFTPELASNNPEIRFVINRASSPFRVMETLKHEVRSDAMTEGFTSNEIDKTILPLTERIWSYYVGIQEKRVPVSGLERQTINQRLAKLNSHERFGQWFLYDELANYDSALYQARAMRYAYDPAPYLQTIETPLFYVMAGKDKNIPTAHAIERLKALQADGKDITIKLYPDASHYLYRFGLEDGPFEGWLYYDDYLSSMTDWALEQIKE